MRVHTVYVVFKQGIYRHECGGVFLTVSEAEAAALTLLAGEPDDYHYYTIVPFIVGVRTPQTPLTMEYTDTGMHYGPRYSGGDLDEGQVWATYRRTNSTISITYAHNAKTPD